MTLREQYNIQKDRAQRTCNFFQTKGVRLVLIKGKYGTSISIIGLSISHAYLDELVRRGTRYRIIEKITPQ